MKVYLGLGSNVGDAISNVLSAIESIKTASLSANTPLNVKALRCVESSSLYRSSAQNFTEQDDFINAVISIETMSSPWEVLALCQQIEALFVSKKQIRFGPRILDVDLLLYGNQLIQHPPKLIVPHPRMHQRRFVIEPLIELMGEDAVIEIPRHQVDDNNFIIGEPKEAETIKLSTLMLSLNEQQCARINHQDLSA